jgi:hypothetical protein
VIYVQQDIDKHTLKGEFVVVVAPKNWKEA